MFTVREARARLSPSEAGVAWAGDLEKRRLVGVYPNQTDGTPIHCSNDLECLTGARLSRTGACDAPAKVPRRGGRVGSLAKASHLELGHVIMCRMTPLSR